METTFQTASEYHFMYGFWAIQSFWWLVLLIAAVLAVALLFWDRIGRVLVLAAPVWVPLAFLMFYLLGAGAAGGDYRNHKDSGFQRYPWVRVWTEPDTEVPKLNVIRQELAEGKYRLLLQTDQTLYLIKPKGGREMPTLQVPKGRIRALRRIPTNPGSR